MADTLRDRVAAALVWTTDQIEQGRGKSQRRIMDMYLGDIQRHLGRSIPDELPRYALRVACVEDDPGGPEVAADKTRSGLFVITANVAFFSKDEGWARTFTSGFELAGCRAEPVTCSIKGRRSAGFRVTGAKRGVFALDPAIAGREGGQTRVRDRIVSTFNGEEQAGPGERDTSDSVQTAVVRLVSVPSTSPDVRNPPLDAEGRLVLAPGELILYQGRHEVTAPRHEPVAFGNAWHTAPGPAAPAEVSITNRRIAASWMDWSGDPSSGHLIDRRRRAGFSEEDDGQMVVAAQLTAAWISNIYFGRSESSLEFQASDRGMQVRLRLLGFGSTEAERLMREAAAAVASYRLATDETVTPEESATLGMIRDGQASAKELSWGLGIDLPSSFKIGRDPASVDGAAKDGSGDGTL